MPITNTSYQKDKGRCNGPVMFPGEAYNIYINFTEPISDPAFDTMRLDLVDHHDGRVVAQGVAELEKDPVPDTVFYRIRFSVVCPSLPFGWYQFAIRDTADDTVKCVSNIFQIEEPHLVKNTAFVAWRHEENKAGFLYENDPLWYNTARIPLIQVGYRYEQDRKQYRNAHDRKLRNLLSYRDLVVTLQSYKYAELMHAGAVGMYDHDEIYIDGVYVVPKDNYEIQDELRTDHLNANQDVFVDLGVKPPAGALTDPEYLVDHLFDEILANGDFIIVR